MGASSCLVEDLENSKSSRLEAAPQSLFHGRFQELAPMGRSYDGLSRSALAAQ